ncbi:MAG: HEAT repeat domain-containing protein [Sandaracinaceae bacterium]
MLLAGLVLSASVVELGKAQDHSTALRVLHRSHDFRARVRAALALGASNDPDMARPLIEALSDRNPAVRAAAATSLGRLGHRAALAPLRRLERDRQQVVRTEARRAIRRIEDASRSRQPTAPSAAPRALRGGPGRYPSISVVPRERGTNWRTVNYVVVVGDMEDRSTFRGVDLSPQLLQEVSRALVVLRGVAVMHGGRIPPTAEREIQRRHIPKLRLEGSVNRVERRAERRDLSVRCEVSLMLMDEPGRAIRGVLSGAATGRSARRGPRTRQEASLAQQALTGAVRSAMSGAARAIASAGRR